MTPKIKKISLNQANRITELVFSNYSDSRIIRSENKKSDFELSRGVFLGRKLIGVYLLREENHESLSGKGIHGISLCILPEYRELGFGKLLIEYSESLPFNYIWGRHPKVLNNLDHWLKRRSFLNEDSYFFITYKVLPYSEK